MAGEDGGVCSGGRAALWVWESKGKTKDDLKMLGICGAKSELAGGEERGRWVPFPLSSHAKAHSSGHISGPGEDRGAASPLHPRPLWGTAERMSPPPGAVGGETLPRGGWLRSGTTFDFHSPNWPSVTYPDPGTSKKTLGIPAVPPCPLPNP